MSNQNKRPHPDDFMDFLQFIFGLQEQEQEQEQEHEPDGFVIHSDFGDVLIEAIDQQVRISVSDVTVMRLDLDESNQTVTVQTFDYQSPTNDCVYEQVIQTETDKNESDLRAFVQQWQDEKMVITLDMATSPTQDAYILTKKLDNSSDNDSFQVWYVPNRGPDSQPIYDEVLWVDTTSTLGAGLRLFNRVCQKASAK